MQVFYVVLILFLTFAIDYTEFTDNLPISMHEGNKLKINTSHSSQNK